MADIVPPVPLIDEPQQSFIDRVISETSHESVMLASKTGFFVALYLLLTILSRAKKTSRVVTQLTIWACAFIVVYNLRMKKSPSVLEIGLPVSLMVDMYFAHKYDRRHSEMVAAQIVLLVISSFLVGLNSRLEGNPILVNVGLAGSIIALLLGIGSNAERGSLIARALLV